MTETRRHADIPTVVIAGGGFGGIQLAKGLKNKPVKVLLLDRHNYHTFQPLLYQVATGGLEAESIAFPLRKLFKKQRNFRFRLTEVRSVDPVRQIVRTTIGDIPFDYLVLATGSDTNFFGQGQFEHHTMPMKTIPEALNIRSMILQNLEEAQVEPDPVKKEGLLNFAVVGGGPTGVELSGALAELKNHVLKEDYPELDTSCVNIFLIESSPELLGPMSVPAQQKSREFLERMGVRIMTGERVVDYDGERLALRSGMIIHTENVLWSAGVKGEVPEGIDAALLGRGNRIRVDEFNRVRGFEHVFAIGDVAAMPVPAYPDGHPGVAPVAMQQGKHLAANLLRLITGAPMKPFIYRDKGSMATVGRNKAVVDLARFRFQGFFAWLVWMLVHLMSLVGFRNKMITLVNWIWNYFSYDRGTRLIIRRFDRESRKQDTLSK